MTRDEAIQVLANFYVSTKNPKANHLCEAVYIAIQALKNEQKHGRWKEVPDRSGYVGEPCEACSVCGMQTDYPSNYCPNCGAIMDDTPTEKVDTPTESTNRPTDDVKNELLAKIVDTSSICRNCSIYRDAWNFCFMASECLTDGFKFFKQRKDEV